MSSSNALKYKITVNRSYYAGIFVFLLYSIVISLTLFVTSITIYSMCFYLLLNAFALYAARKAFLQHDKLLLSDSGLVERVVSGTRYHGRISEGSFYNGWFVFLRIDVTTNGISEKSTKQVMTIYKDAIREDQFRLLARLIKNGQS